MNPREEIANPCIHCSGTGYKWYASGSTWRGGVGVAAMTYDQCDTCWGSGDANRPWPSVRKLEAKVTKNNYARGGDWLVEQMKTYYIFGFSNRKAIQMMFETLKDYSLAKTRRRKALSPEEQNVYKCGSGYKSAWESMTFFINDVLLRAVEESNE